MRFGKEKKGGGRGDVLDVDGHLALNHELHALTERGTHAAELLLHALDLRVALALLRSRDFAQLLELVLGLCDAVAQGLDLGDLVVHGLLDLVQEVVVVHVRLEGGVAALCDLLAQGEDVGFDGALEVEVEQVVGRVACAGVLEQAI